MRFAFFILIMAIACGNSPPKEEWRYALWDEDWPEPAEGDSITINIPSNWDGKININKTDSTLTLTFSDGDTIDSFHERYGWRSER